MTFTVVHAKPGLFTRPEHKVCDIHVSFMFELYACDNTAHTIRCVSKWEIIQVRAQIICHDIFLIPVHCGTRPVLF